MSAPRRSPPSSRTDAPSGNRSDCARLSAALLPHDHVTQALRTAVGRLRSQVADLESEQARRRLAHQADLEALCAAHKDAANSARTLRSERAWLASLDEMRVTDLQTIANLEARLRQWELWHPDGDQDDHEPNQIKLPDEPPELRCAS